MPPLFPGCSSLTTAKKIPPAEAFPPFQLRRAELSGCFRILVLEEMGRRKGFVLGTRIAARAELAISSPCPPSHKAALGQMAFVPDTGVKANISLVRGFVCLFYCFVCLFFKRDVHCLLLTVTPHA